MHIVPKWKGLKTIKDTESPNICGGKELESI